MQYENLLNLLSFLNNFNNEKQVKAIDGADVTVLESTSHNWMKLTEYCLGSGKNILFAGSSKNILFAGGIF